MRSKLKVPAVVLALAVIGSLAFGSAVAAADGKGKRTLRLVGIEAQSEFLDLGAPGPSLGDQLVFSDTLFRRGREVGVGGGSCTAVEVTPPYDVITLHCIATLSLRRGQITLQGLVEFQGEDDPGPFVIAVTGGTRAFRNVGGQAVIRSPRPGRTVYRLRLDRNKHKYYRHHRSRGHKRPR